MWNSKSKLKKMSELWNLWDVKPPPVCSVKTDLHFKGISHLNEVTFNALKTLRDFSHFGKEAAVLSRFLYKYRRIFRHDKGIQNLVKVNQCLKKYLKLDMAGILFTFKQALPHNITKATIGYLPTKQMLKWVLLRLQAFAQLFVRVTELAKETAVYVYRKMCLGWALHLSLLVFSITARILTTSKYLVAKSIEWYSSFYKSLPLLQETAEFLPGYEFPADLKLWLGAVDLVPLKKKTFADEIFELIDLANEENDHEGEDSDNEVKIVKEKFVKAMLNMNVDLSVDSDVEEITVEQRKEERKGVKRPKSFPQDEDFGVPVDEDEDDDEADADVDKDETEESSEKRKKFKKKPGRRVKWLKKMKKTLNRYDSRGNSDSLFPKRGSSSNDFYTIID